ncbi:MAG: iron-sulfur cluster assembly scaffold protein [Gemmatimonadota bacterium]
MTSTAAASSEPVGYSEMVLDHFRRPRNAGTLADANAVGRAENSACGDQLELYLRVEDGRVVAVRFRTVGCPAAIAAGSRLTEMIDGRTLEQLGAIRQQDVVAALGGLPPLKVHCSVLAEDAIRAALADFHQRRQ